MPDKEESNGQGQVVTRPRTERKLKRPRMYKVLLHNDDYTPRDFVVMLLQAIFGQSEAEAIRLMLHVHNQGVGVVGLYPFSVAETKVAEVLAAADKANFPLICTLEPDDEGDEGDDGTE